MDYIGGWHELLHGAAGNRRGRGGRCCGRCAWRCNGLLSCPGLTLGPLHRFLLALWMQSLILQDCNEPLNCPEPSGLCADICFLPV